MISTSIDEILFIILVWQVLIFAALFMGIHHNTGSYPKKIIGWFMLANAGYFSVTWLDIFGHTSLLRLVYPFTLPFLLCHLPIFYWYIRTLTDADFRVAGKQWRHLWPSLGVLILQLSFFMLPGFRAVQFLENDAQPGDYLHLRFFLTGLRNFSFYILLSAQFVFYTLKYRTIIQTYRNRIGNIFSYTENVDLKWLQILIIGILLFFVGNELSYIIGFKIPMFSSLYFSVGMIVINFYIGYHSLIQRKEVLKAYYSGIAVENNHPIEVPLIDGDVFKTTTEGELPRYKRSSLKSDARVNIIERLSRLMNEEELFTDTKLSIDDVAQRLEINSKYLSQSINEEFKRNFYIYVNELRVEKAKSYLCAEPQANYSIEGIARQVGFQSKSSFYIAFKRITGLTPSAFRAGVEGKVKSEE